MKKVDIRAEMLNGPHVNCCPVYRSRVSVVLDVIQVDGVKKLICFKKNGFWCALRMNLSDWGCVIRSPEVVDDRID